MHSSGAEYFFHTCAKRRDARVVTGKLLERPLWEEERAAGFIPADWRTAGIKRAQLSVRAARSSPGFLTRLAASIPQEKSDIPRNFRPAT